MKRSQVSGPQVHANLLEKPDIPFQSGAVMNPTKCSKLRSQSIIYVHLRPGIMPKIKVYIAMFDAYMEARKLLFQDRVRVGSHCS